MQYDPKNPNLLVKQKVGAMKVIHTALLVGQIAFAVVMLLQSTGGEYSLESLDTTYLSIVSVLTLSGYLLGRVLYKRQIEKAVIKPTLELKLTGFQTGLVIRMALMEGPCLVSMLYYSFTGNIVYLAIAGLIIAYFISLRPSREKIQNDLSLSDEERMMFHW